jgi:DNA gyrase subunit B
MDVEILRDKQRYTLRFEKGENVGGLKSEPFSGKTTGTTIKWRPDIEVFTDIDIPLEYYLNVLKKQAVVNPGIVFVLRDEQEGNTFDEYTFVYENGIVDYVKEIAGSNSLTQVQYYEAERVGRDREDKPDYWVKLSAAFCSAMRSLNEYYHDSSYLGCGFPTSRKSAFLSVIDHYLKNTENTIKRKAKFFLP